MTLHITWCDNAAFRLDRKGQTIWFDPAVNKNPDSPVKVDDICDPAKFVFTTHGDPGHFVNSIEITKKTGAHFVGPADLCEVILQKQLLSQAQLIPLDFGETKMIDDLEVYLFEAIHPELTDERREVVRKWGGAIETRNSGFVVRSEDFTLCLLGDSVYSDVFKDIGQKFSIDFGMIPIQGKSKGSPIEEAVESGAAIVRDLNVKFLFPVIQYTREFSYIDPLKRKLKEMGSETQLIFDKPGVVYTF